MEQKWSFNKQGKVKTNENVQQCFETDFGKGC